MQLKLCMCYAIAHISVISVLFEKSIVLILSMLLKMDFL